VVAMLISGSYIVCRITSEGPGTQQTSLVDYLAIAVFVFTMSLVLNIVLLDRR
jgi:hypothetical protein